MARRTNCSNACVLLAIAGLACAAFSWSGLRPLTNTAFVTGALPVPTAVLRGRVAPGPQTPLAAAAYDDAPTEPITEDASSGFSMALLASGIAMGLMAAVAWSAPAQAAGPAWSHTDIPAWNTGYPMCTAKSQSPIDIPVAKVDGSNATDSLAKRVKYAPLGEREIVHNSHVMQVNGGFGSFGLPDGQYDVKQFHFHFPAEHKIDGKLGAGELHIVHQKKGAEGTDGLAVIGVVLEESKAASGPELKFLSALGFGQELPKDGEKKAVSEAVDLNNFADELGGGFYHYSGSLTTPPCAEKVHWYVAKKAAPVTKEMIASFRSRFPENGDNRPVQPVNGRTIVSNDIDVDGEF